MIRVLAFGRYADQDFGGLERHVFELARSLEGEARFCNIVAARGAPPELQLAGETVYAHTFASLGGVPLCPTMPLHAWRLHRRERFDIAHLHFPADPMAHLAMAMLPRSVGRVITWHSDIVRQRRLLKAYRPFLDALLRSADAIILPTPAHLTSSRQLAAVRDSARFTVVPYGFDLARFRARPPLADELRARAAGRPIVFALGRHVYYKGFEILLRAMREVPGAVLLLGGSGPLTGELKELARASGVAERVEFAGRIPEPDLPAYYHACDVFCMPSTERSEAFGIVQLEAMACGKPVVCSDLRNGVNWLNRDGETGLCVPPSDAAALARALDDLLRRPAERARLGEAGRKRAFGDFTLQAMAQNTLALYRRVLARA